MRRAVKSLRSLGAVFAVAAMALLILSSSSEATGGARQEFTGYDEVEGLDQVIAKRWLSTLGNPELVHIDWVQGFVATLFLFGDDEQAADGFAVIESGARDIVAELLEVDPETDTFERWEDAGLELNGAQTASWRATLVNEEESMAAEIVVTLVQESTFLVMTTGFVVPAPDTSMPDDLVEWLDPEAVELSNGILTRPADEAPVSGSGDRWSGGVWGMFPSDENELPIVARLSDEVELVIYQSPAAIASATAEAEAEATRSAIVAATASAEAEAARATATAEAIAAEATATAEVRALIDNAPPGLIAYTADSNIWVMQADGSGAQQITTDGESGFNDDYANPAWSHDGTMLAFTGRLPDTYDSDILVYRDGHLTPIPGTAWCHHPVFSADNERVLYSCDPSKAYDHDHAGLVTSSKIDGTDQQLHLEFPIEEEWSPTTDWRLVGLDVRPSDGAVLVAVLDEKAPEVTVELYDAEFKLDTTVDIAGMFGPDAFGPYNARFTVDGEGIVGAMCLASCRGYQDQVSPVWATFDGETGTYPVPESGSIDVVAAAPDGVYVVMGNATWISEIVISDGSGGSQIVGEGVQPVWQPVSVEIETP